MSHLAPTPKPHQTEKGLTQFFKKNASNAGVSTVIDAAVHQALEEEKRMERLARSGEASWMSNTYVMLILWYHKDQPKPKLKKLCLKLQKRVGPATAQGILRRILNASDPSKEIVKAGDEVTEFETILRGLGDAGHHGVAVFQKEVYPILFTFEEDADYQWAIENENFMRVKAAHALMNLLSLKELSCEVLLFGTKGFSAEYTGVHVARASSNKEGVTLTQDGMIVE